MGVIDYGLLVVIALGITCIAILNGSLQLPTWTGIIIGASFVTGVVLVWCFGVMGF